MLVVDLHCEKGHLFEGWFASGDDLQSQRERGLLACPVCGSHEVVRRPSASRLNVSALKAAKLEGTMPQAAAGRAERPAEAAVPAAAEAGTEAARPNAAAALAALQELYIHTVRQVLDRTEDVGERFVEEVRSMHQGEIPERPIRGEASAEERAELKEEGIDVVSLPVPGFMKPKGTLQ